MRNLFDLIEDSQRKEINWTPEPLPSLDGVTDIQLNFETTGFKWWDGDKPLGFSLCRPGGKTNYWGWGHRGGGNIPEEQAKEWFQREVRGKRITNSNTRFDVHFGRVWGIDLEGQGNQVSDIQHYAGLLDDHRYRFGLDVLVNDFLGYPPEVGRLDESRMADYHAGEVAPRSEYNVLAVRQIRDKMWPELTKQNLHRVRLLEDKLIFVTCEMEKNGALIDVEKLDLWLEQTEKLLQDWYLQIFRETGLKVNFGSNKDMTALFNKLGVGIDAFTATGKGSFTDAILKKIEHPTVKLVRKAVRLRSLRSKYFVKYRKTIDSNGILRYALHQMRESRDDIEDADSEGTGFGRYSSSSLHAGDGQRVGANIQQCIKVDKQIRTFGDEFILRELHIPRSGLWFRTDAMQIEYRLFAEEANNPSVIAQYKKDPMTSFHKFMWEKVKKYQPDFSYRQQKDLNFANMYCAGLRKKALMLEFVSKEQYLDLLKLKDNISSHPLLRETVEINRIFDQVMPEVKGLNWRAQQIAKNRGYIKTILGRRARFGGLEPEHKALNRRIQGTAADIMKMKAIELHENRQETCFLMRYPIHDEFDGDIPDEHHAKKVEAILNRQAFPNRKIPILWENTTGVNWKICCLD